MSESPTDVDVFGEGAMSGKTPPATAAPTPAPAAVTPALSKGKPAGKQGAKKAGGIPNWAILAAVGLAGAVWVFWPSSPAPRSRLASPVANTAVAIKPVLPDSSAAIRPEIPQPLDTSSSSEEPAISGDKRVDVAGPVVSVASAPMAPTLPATASVSADPATTSPATTQSAAAAPTQQQFAALDAQVKQDAETLGTVQSAVKALASQVDGMGHAGTAKRHARAAQAKKAADEVRALNGDVYSITSIGRGVAWIQAGSHLEIVQPGDRIGTTRVLTIDPVGRRVITADGVIR